MGSLGQALLWSNPNKKSGIAISHTALFFQQYQQITSQHRQYPFHTQSTSGVAPVDGTGVIYGSPLE